MRISVRLCRHFFLRLLLSVMRLVDPCRGRGRERGGLVGERVAKCDATGVEAEWRIGWAGSHGNASLVALQVGLIAEDGVAEVPQVQTDLVRPAGVRAGLKEGGAVVLPAQNHKVGVG